MKKIILVLCSILFCCGLNVSATEKDDVKACEALSNEKQVCTINDDGECECVEFLINPLGIDHAGNGN